jgi:heme-degrading monooxygenase HmoA
LPDLKKVAGYAGAQLLVRDQSDQSEIIVITFWQSLESIRAFAGDDLEKAVVTDEAAALMSCFDERVKHYRLLIQDGFNQASKV